MTANSAETAGGRRANETVLEWLERLTDEHNAKNNHFVTAATRRDCKERLVGWFINRSETWPRLYRNGYRIVRVNISEG